MIQINTKGKIACSRKNCKNMSLIQNMGEGQFCFHRKTTIIWEVNFKEK